MATCSPIHSASISLLEINGANNLGARTQLRCMDSMSDKACVSLSGFEGVLLRNLDIRANSFDCRITPGLCYLSVARRQLLEEHGDEHMTVHTDYPLSDGGVECYSTVSDGAVMCFGDDVPLESVRLAYGMTLGDGCITIGNQMLYFVF